MHNAIHMGNMNFWKGGVNQNVGNKGDYKFPQYVSKHIIDQTLEHQGGTIEAIWHYAVIVVARGGLPLMPFSDADTAQV